VVPPPIGRYYFLDLRPGRSFVEYAVSRGLQVFMLSWRNPGRNQRDWDADTYAGRVLSAIDTVLGITGARDLSTLGFCAGGILQSAVLSHLAASDDRRVANASFAVTLLDFSSPAPLGAVMSPSLLRGAQLVSGARGTLDAKSLATVFSWMRPDDLVTNYWRSRYLMGEDPPVFDILAWNADATNLPAALHRDFLRVLRENALVTPGGTTVLGTPVDLSSITVPTFVTGAITDHLTPWEACYRTTQLLSGPSTFVLSNAGHIASLVNPPGGKKASYWTGGPPGPDPKQWQASAEQQPGSWWEAWADWMLERSGPEVDAPAELGGEVAPVIAPAPGRYVLAAAG
jgi:polyhydroxyalkanoate synthase subunit PhaC